MDTHSSKQSTNNWGGGTFFCDFWVNFIFGTENCFFVFLFLRFFHTLSWELSWELIICTDHEYLCGTRSRERVRQLGHINTNVCQGLCPHSVRHSGTLGIGVVGMGVYMGLRVKVQNAVWGGGGFFSGPWEYF